MREAKDNPESLDSFREDAGGPIYSVSQFRVELKNRDRKIARLRNLIRLAETLSSEPRVKKTLKEALDG